MSPGTMAVRIVVYRADKQRVKKRVMNGSQAKRVGERVQKLISHARQRAKTTQHKEKWRTSSEGSDRGTKRPNRVQTMHCRHSATVKQEQNESKTGEWWSMLKVETRITTKGGITIVQATTQQALTRCDKMPHHLIPQTRTEMVKKWSWMRQHFQIN